MAKGGDKPGAEEGGGENRAWIETEGRAQPFCVLCKLDIGDTPKAIKAHLKSKPHKTLLRNLPSSNSATAPGGDGDAKKRKNERVTCESDSDSGEKKKDKKKKKKDKKKREPSSSGSDSEDDDRGKRNKEKKKLKKKREASDNSDSEEDAPRPKKKKGLDGHAEARQKVPVAVPAGCLAVNVAGIPASATQKSQGALRKLFPKATKVVYGAPGKARVCFLETADIPDALAVDGRLLDGAKLSVTPESAEEVAAEAEKAAAGHEVFLKWLPPIATEEELAELFKSCGEILGDVRLKRNPQDGSCMGIGWITFATAEGSKKACLKSGTRYPGGPPGRGINVTPATVTLATTAARERGSLQAAGTHTPAMCEETLRVLVLPDPDGVYVDGTFGRGGHSRAILSRLSAKGRLHAFDLDPDAIKVGKELEREDSRFKIHHKPFGHMAQVLEDEGLRGAVSGVFLDLGISSPQFDSTNRGFRPEMDGPLDLRFDLTRGQSGAYIPHCASPPAQELPPAARSSHVSPPARTPPPLPSTLLYPKLHPGPYTLQPSPYTLNPGP